MSTRQFAVQVNRFVTVSHDLLDRLRSYDKFTAETTRRRLVWTIRGRRLWPTTVPDHGFNTFTSFDAAKAFRLERLDEEIEMLRSERDALAEITEPDLDDIKFWQEGRTVEI